MQFKADATTAVTRPDTVQFAFQLNLCCLRQLINRLRFAGTVFVALELGVHVLRLVNDELRWILLEHGNARRTLELLGGHRTAAPQYFLLVLTHNKEPDAVGHDRRTSAQGLCEEDEHILRIGHLIVGQYNCKSKADY